jgi:hypothetical protein
MHDVRSPPHLNRAKLGFGLREQWARQLEFAAIRKRAELERW